ncbi:MAG: hypothetical protein KF764_21680 [Labilithrix sp.]|nr:hypothetical protein [Labilithrix sp.]MBX3221892.1 hypothetical protein [Labilithrix sp.]
MKKAALALTTLIALSATTVALAQEPTEDGSPTAEPGAAVPAPPAAKAPPSAGAPRAEPCPVAMTTITSADVTATPMPVTPPPAGETITLKQSYRPNRPLLYTGSTMLVGSYAATAAATAMRQIRDANGDQSLYIPVAGPWLHLANSKHTPLDQFLIAGSGVAQGAGVVITVLSLLVPEHIPAATIQAGGVKVQLTGTSYGRGSAGIGAVGQF